LFNIQAHIPVQLAKYQASKFYFSNDFCFFQSQSDIRQLEKITVPAVKTGGQG